MKIFKKFILCILSTLLIFISGCSKDGTDTKKENYIPGKVHPISEMPSDKSSDESNESYSQTDLYISNEEDEDDSVSSGYDPEALKGTCGDKITWEIIDNTIIFSGTGPMEDYQYPDEIPWLDQANKLFNSVVIEEGITSVGSRAFAGSSCNIKSITLPNSLTKIGEYAFWTCGFE